MKVRWLIFFLTFWLAPSVLVDFVAAPSIFRNVSSLQEAGTLGMIIFKSLNTLEVLLALPVLILSGLLAREEKIKKYFMPLFVLLFIWAGMFRFYISPTIIDINEKRYELSETSSEYKELSNQHDFYHKLYVKLEGAKVIMLVAGLVVVFRIREEQAV